MAFANGYSYRRSITVDNANVGADLAGFPVLISGTYAYLAHADHGGQCTDANGYDIAFYADEAGTTPLYWEIESYNHETGAVAFWVKVDLDTDADTVFYMFYANAAVSTFQSTATSVWSAYAFVYHMNESGATLEDSTASNLDGTKDGAAAPAANATGKISGCQDFTSDKFVTLDGTDPTAYSVSMWVKFDAGIETQATRSGVTRTDGGGPGGSYSHELRTGWINPDCRLQGMVYAAGGKIATGTTALVKDTWYHIAATAANSGTLKIYLNGALEGESGAIGTMWTGGDRWWVGIGHYAAFSGAMDEFHYARSVLPVEWFAAEYANQNSPATFYALGDEETPATTIELAGTSAGVCTVSGTVQVSRQLAGTSAGGSTAAGALGVTRGLAGVSAGAASVAAALLVSRLLAGAAAGGSLATAALSIPSTRRMFGTPPSGAPRLFGTPPSGAARMFGSAPSAGTPRVFKE